MTDPAPLSPRAIRHLRALGHSLKPVVQIGKEGITPALIEATKSALLTHELIKVRILGEAPVDRHAAGDEVARGCSATLAQVLGRTFLLFRRNAKKPKLLFPGEKAPDAPKNAKVPRKSRKAELRPERGAGLRELKDPRAPRASRASTRPSTRPSDAGRRGRSGRPRGSK